jgi:hypothetical protein
MNQNWWSGYRRYEELILELLRHLNLSPETDVRIKAPDQRWYEADALLPGRQDNGPTAVEIKFYRFRSPPAPEIFQRALEQTERVRQYTKASKGLLIASCLAEQIPQNLMEDFPDIVLWDIETILKQAVPYPTIFDGLINLFEIDPRTVPVAAESRHPDDASEKIRTYKGDLLARTLKNIPSGNADATNFENACIRALKYLFHSDLVGWHEQLETHDNLHRRDLICRVLPHSDVWKFIMSDLQSRYVIFEFKNYTDPIGQQEIITTERYLYPTALRRVAIMISPKGTNASAQKVIDGAMREEGKLILSMTVDEVAKLLTGKDEGSDPNVFLFEKVDGFLMRLSR